MSELTAQLGRFVAEARWEDVPAAVREHTKLVFLDTLGVMLAGSLRPEVAGLRAALAGGAGSTVYAPGFPCAEPRLAALLNGTAGRSIELCEGHRFVSCQGAVQALPAVLAVAEARGRPGVEALAALALGYDVAVRIGSGVTPRALAHQNGQWPMLGAVAAGARLRGLDAAQTDRALRIGAALLLTPGYTSAVGGATALNVAGGMSGLAGALAPELGLAGFEARDDAVEEAFGSLVGDGFDPSGVTEGLGQRWEITRNYFRLRACCNPTYAALDALEETLAQARPRPEDVERIEVRTYRFASAMRETNPANVFASRYSLPHAAAATVVYGSASYAAFSEEALRDWRLVALRQKVAVAEDPDLSRLVPQAKPARVRLVLRDGRSFEARCDNARGDFQRPYTEPEVRAKFRELAGLVLTADGASAVEDYVGRLDQAVDVGELAAVCRQYERAGGA